MTFFMAVSFFSGFVKRLMPSNGRTESGQRADGMTGGNVCAVQANPTDDRFRSTRTAGSNRRRSIPWQRGARERWRARDLLRSTRTARGSVPGGQIDIGRGTAEILIVCE